MRSYKLRLVLLVVFAAFVLAACAEKAGKEGAKTEAAKGGKGVIAAVDGKDLTVDDLKAEAESLSPFAVKALSNKEVREKILDNLVTKRLIMLDAEKSGLDKDPEVAKKLEEMKNKLLIEQFIKKNIVEKVNPSDKEIRDYFDKNKQDLGSVRLSHILVATEAEAEAVLAKAKAGEDFAKLAKEHSLDTTTKSKGGDLGKYFSWSQFGNPGLKEAAFKLKKGEMSGIVQGQDGYHILKVVDKKPAADSDFDIMKEELAKYVGDQKKKELFESTVKALKDKWKVVTYKEALDSADFGASEKAPAPTNVKPEEGGKSPAK